MLELLIEAFVLNFIGVLQIYIVQALNDDVDSYSGIIWQVCMVYGCLFAGKLIGMLIDGYLELDKMKFNYILFLCAAGIVFSFGFCNDIYSVALVELLLGFFLGIFLKPAQLSMMKIGGFVVFSLISAVSCLLCGASFDPTEHYSRISEVTFLQKNPIFVPATALTVLIVVAIITESVDNSSSLKIFHESSCSSLILSKTAESQDSYYRVDDRSISSSLSTASIVLQASATHPDTHPSPSRKSITTCSADISSSSAIEPKLIEIMSMTQKHNIKHYSENSPLPERYIRGCQGDLTEAARRWRFTLNWRRDNQIDDILFTKQESFAVIKQCYPHFICGRSRSSCPVYVERLGYINLEALKAAGVSIDRLLNYYSFLSEYLWTAVNPDFEHGQLVTILDVESVSIGALTGEPLDFIKRASKVVQDHYVERCYRMFIVNAPIWFSFIWNVVKSLLNENTRRKIVILGPLPRTGTWPELEEIVDVSQLPALYGGHGCDLNDSADEVRLAEYVRMINQTPVDDDDHNHYDDAVSVAGVSSLHLPSSPHDSDNDSLHKSSIWQSFSSQQSDAVTNNGFMTTVVSGIGSVFSYLLPSSTSSSSNIQSSLLQDDDQQGKSRQDDIESKLAHYQATGHFDLHLNDNDNDDDESEYEDARSGLEDQNQHQSIGNKLKLTESDLKTHTDMTKNHQNAIPHHHHQSEQQEQQHGSSKCIIIACLFHSSTLSVFLLIPSIMFLPECYHGADIDAIWCGLSLSISLFSIGILFGSYFYIMRQKRELKELQKGKRTISAFGSLSSPSLSLKLLIFVHVVTLIVLLSSVPFITGLYCNDESSKSSSLQTYLTVIFLSFAFGVNFAEMCWCRLSIQSMSPKLVAGVHLEKVSLQLCEAVFVVVTFAMLAVSASWKETDNGVLAYLTGISLPLSLLIIIDVLLIVYLW